MPFQYQRQPRRSFGATLTKFRVEDTSTFSRRSSLTILWITRHNREPAPTRRVFGSSTRTFVKRSRISTRKSTGTYKTYHGTHEGTYLGVAPTHRQIQFETVDVMRVQDGKITDHWGVANLLSLMQQIGGWTPPPSAAIER
jgi:hypothetical protein